jgi:hypothetical protein
MVFPSNCYHPLATQCSKVLCAATDEMVEHYSRTALPPNRVRYEGNHENIFIIVRFENGAGP